MGLTIHNAFQAPKGTTEEQAIALVKKMHQKALDLPFETVSDVHIFRGQECNFESKGRDENGQLKDEFAWEKIEAGQYLDLPKRKSDKDGWRTSVGITPNFICSFSAWPGKGCESFNVVLAHYPETIETTVKNKWGWPVLKTYKTRIKGYSGRCFCKTQYASNPDCGGIENFLKCHLVVIKMLDYAKEIGILKHVSDEGNYWKKRDIQALASEVGSWNSMIAGMFGAIKDSLGQGDVKIQGEIQKFSNFESLEFKGQNEQQNKLIEQIKSLTDKK